MSKRAAGGAHTRRLGLRCWTVHGRSRAQFYKGHADWQAIRAFVIAFQSRLIANGDIVDAQTATRALAQSGADGGWWPWRAGRGHGCCAI